MFTKEKNLGGIRINANAKLLLSDKELIELLLQEKARLQELELLDNPYYNNFDFMTQEYDIAVNS